MFLDAKKQFITKEVEPSLVEIDTEKTYYVPFIHGKNTDALPVRVKSAEIVFDENGDEVTTLVHFDFVFKTFKKSLFGGLNERYVVVKNDAPIFKSFIFTEKEDAKVAISWLISNVTVEDFELLVSAKTFLYEKSLRNAPYVSEIVEKNYDFDFNEYFKLPVAENIQKAAEEYFRVQSESVI